MVSLQYKLRSLWTDTVKIGVFGLQTLRGLNGVVSTFLALHIYTYTFETALLLQSLTQQRILSGFFYPTEEG